MWFTRDTLKLKDMDGVERYRKHVQTLSKRKLRQLYCYQKKTDIKKKHIIKVQGDST